MPFEIILSLIKFIGGLALVIKGADLLISGASGLARRIGIPDTIIGLTLVAFGTSLPEFTINIKASLKDASEITLGNVIGSNIANILLILGISGLIRPVSIHLTFVKKEIPLNFLSTLILFAMVSDTVLDGNGIAFISRSEGLVLVTTFVGYIYFLTAFLERQVFKDGKQLGYLKGSILIIIGLLGLIMGSEWTVSGGIELATFLGISQMIIGLFLIAVGTSLPELATSIVAAYKGNSDIAVGNILGSNIFNVSFVLGASALINSIPVPTNVFKDMTILFVATFLFFISNYLGRKYTISKAESIAFLVIYILYAAYSWYLEV
ncbi:Inner membrane protein YrbG [bacterium HR37]|jgi:cation:H+ antiporter|nr:Inner membrane protein YrbG [bacterium HR37]